MYQLRFSDKVLEKLEKIGDILLIHEVLAEAYHLLRSNPYKRDVVPPATHIRYLKTRPYQRGDLSIPALTFYFTINEEEKLVKVIDVIYRNKDGELEL